MRQLGVRSLWRSTYEVRGPDGVEAAVIREENPWVKALDGLAESLPGGDALGGLFFNPAYLVESRGRTVMRLRKERSLLEGRFTLHRTGDFPEDEERLLLAGAILVILLERDRG
ncbi:MAG: hypothetical protein IN808_07235 [Rubrobacter sp.]|nr:hypothetical protein [Rubrobacter sp.]